MVGQTSVSSPRLPECHPRDGPGMKPIFDGVYINQILLQGAGTVSELRAAQRVRPVSPSALLRPRAGSPLLAEWSFKPS